MAFLSILEPILSKKRGLGLPDLRGQNAPASSIIGYTEHHDATTESDDNSGPSDTGDSTQMRTYRGAEGMINRFVYIYIWCLSTNLFTFIFDFSGLELNRASGNDKSKSRGETSTIDMQC